MVFAVALIGGAIAAYLLTRPHAATTTAQGPGNCAPSAILVNPCRPWFGAAANRNPGAPQSRIAQFDYVEKLVGHRLEANIYPRLMMYLAYDDAGGPKSGPGCLSNYNQFGQPDAVKQANFNQFARAVLSRGQQR